ncbi:hypothetical protein PGTUg99_037476 [Puccinia graminis f. sp. tritici]|uniref:Uncharacterized protein n=1 Tax=Puccinia graminis f. sp. tritici TaxID=56615 RepID=A0A5B0S330_PUCGR|nr:hypothetical protein PGTUg99_037476 [Puccinia graminis f. sp. tritici]
MDMSAALVFLLTPSSQFYQAVPGFGSLYAVDLIWMPPDLETNFGRQPRGLPYVDTKGTVHLLVLWLLIFEGQQEITHSALVITRWSSNAISISSAQYQFHKFNSGYQWLRPKDNRSVDPSRCQDLFP